MQLSSPFHPWHISAASVNLDSIDAARKVAQAVSWDSPVATTYTAGPVEEDPARPADHEVPQHAASRSISLRIDFSFVAVGQ
jgi:hypothetical protein